MNWTDAEDFCRKEGGHLASVDSYATNNFVLEGMNRRNLDYIWLGGHDIGEEGTWKWTDCATWGFHSWAKGEPNDADDDGRNENCLELVRKWTSYGNIWNDVSCVRNHPFLCSKKICPGRKFEKNLHVSLSWIWCKFAERQKQQ